MNDSLYFDVGASPQETAAALLRHGCIVIRGAVDPAPLPRLYAHSIRLFKNVECEPVDIVRERGWCNGGDLGRVAFGDIDAVAKLVARPIFARHLEAMLAQVPALHPLYAVRYRDPAEPATALPYHQHPHHSPPGELSDTRTRLVGVVIPFTEFDGSCSDVELITLPMVTLYPPTDSPETQFASFELDHKMVLGKFGEHRWRPRLALGDVIVFREGTLHRSYVEPTMTKTRASVDLRVFGAVDPITVFRGADGILLPSFERIRAPA